MDKLCREKARKRGRTLEQVYQEYVDEMALRRVTVSRDIANAALFLASDESSNITGQSMTVDGGRDVSPGGRGRPLCSHDSAVAALPTATR
jgi:3-oxoacyl-[acyl-carrier protein] reductase